MKPKVQCKCVSKKETINHDVDNTISWTIELEVPYDQNSIYWKMSGGSNFQLNTVNKEAADMFEVGKEYNITIGKAEEDEVSTTDHPPKPPKP